MYYEKMLVNTKAAIIDNPDKLLEDVQSECNTFNNIIESIVCLDENSIVLEKLDFSNLGEKIRNAWKNLVAAFNKYVIEPIKKLFEKIFSKKLQKDTEELKNNASPEILRLEFHPENDQVSESTITESSKRDLQLKLFVERQLCPECFFKLSNYINASELAKTNQLISENNKKLADYYAKIKAKNAVDLSEKAINDPEFAKMLEFEQEALIDAYNKTIIGIDIDDMADIDAFRAAIEKDLEKKMPKTISFASLLSVIEDNIKNASNDINDLKKSISILESSLKYMDSFLNGEKNVTKYLMKVFSTISTMFNTSIKLYHQIFGYVTTMYTKSGTILEAMKTLNEIA